MTRAPKTREKAERLSAPQRKAQILAAARSLFAGKGYTEVTLDEIAQRVGVSRPRVIQLFGSKQSIYEAIAESAYASHPMDQDLADPMARKDDLAVFRIFAEHVLTHTANKEDREIFKILMYARLKEDRFHRLHFHKKDTLMMGRLWDYVGMRMQEGVLRPMDPRLVVYAYQAMISNLAIYKNVLKQMEFVSIEELSLRCAEIFLSGLSCGGVRGPGIGEEAEERGQEAGGPTLKAPRS